MKWYPSILQVQKADEPKSLSKAFCFILGLGMPYYKERDHELTLGFVLAYVDFLRFIFFTMPS